MVTVGVLTIPAGFTDALLFGFVPFPDSFLNIRPKRPPMTTVSTLLYVQRPLQQITDTATWDPKSVEGSRGLCQQNKMTNWPTLFE